MKQRETTTIRPATRDEWLAVRGSGIGSSEVGTILGVNPWETPYQLWRRKKGLDAPKSETIVMKAGHFLEDAVSLFFQDATGRRVIDRSKGDWIIRDNEHPYMQVSPDRIYWTGEKGASRGILECKTTRMKIDEDDLPKHWFCQLQYQMGVSRITRGALAWLTGGSDFGWKDIKFDPIFFDWMKAQVTGFWTKCIEGGQEPPAINEDDVDIMFHRGTVGSRRTADEDVLAQLQALKDLKAQAAAIEAEKSKAEAAVKLFMGDAESLTTADGRVLATWKNAKDSVKFDAKAFAAEHPDAAAPYMKAVEGSRRFLVKA